MKKTAEQLGIAGPDAAERAERVNRIRDARASRKNEERRAKREGRVTAHMVWDDETGRYSVDDLDDSERAKFERLADKNRQVCQAIERWYESIYGRQITIWPEGDQYVARDDGGREVATRPMTGTLTMEQLAEMLAHVGRIRRGKVYYRGQRVYLSVIPADE